MASSKIAALTLKVEESSTKERRVGLAALGTLRLSARSSLVVLTVRAMAVVVTTVVVRVAVVAMVTAMVVVLETAMTMVTMMAMAMVMVAVVTVADGW